MRFRCFGFHYKFCSVVTTIVVRTQTTWLPSVPLKGWIHLILAGGHFQADLDQIWLKIWTAIQASDLPRPATTLWITAVLIGIYNTMSCSWSICTIQAPNFTHLYMSHLLPTQFTTQEHTQALSLEQNWFTLLLIFIQLHADYKPMDVIKICMTALHQLKEVGCLIALFLLILLGLSINTDYENDW